MDCELNKHEYWSHFNKPDFVDEPLCCYGKDGAADARSRRRQPECNSTTFLEPMGNNAHGRSEDHTAAKLENRVSQRQYIFEAPTYPNRKALT